MTDLQAQLSGLSADEKRALAAQLLAKRLGGAKTVHTQSFGQQQWWFIHLMHPESLALAVPFPMRIVSRVDLPALKRSFQHLVDRHSVLRTTYTMLAGEPMQEVHSRAEVAFDEVDAVGWTDQELRERVNAEHLRPFDLEKGPVLRVTLFSRSATDHVLCPVVHHIAFDGLSLGILLEDLRHLYVAEVAGRPNPLPPQKGQYTDFCAWQFEALGGPEGERLREYWSQQLSGELPRLNLPTDRPRVQDKEFLPLRHEFPIDPELMAGLRALAREHRTTLYTILLSTFFVQLHRYTGQDDIVCASPMGGRTRPEFEGIVGALSNPVLMRARFSPGMTFADLLRQMHQTVLDAIDHQDYPWAALSAELRAKSADRKRDRFFDVSFNINALSRLGGFLQHLDPTAPARSTVAGLEIERFDLDQAEEGTDLFLNLIESDQTIVYRFRYNPDLFDRETIVRMQGHIETLLRGIVADPNQAVARLPLLTPAERQQLLVDWNATEADYPSNARIHDLFEAQVAATPSAVALVSDLGLVTYAELNTQANRLAHYLLRLGVVPETKVGVYLPRSIGQAVAALAVLKAGAAYLPLDPTYPRERLDFMLRDSGAPIVLTASSLLSDPLGADTRFVCLDSDSEAIAVESAENPSVATGPDSLACILYTSGSTGLPKGVLTLHCGAVNRFAWMWEAYPFQPGEVCALTTTLSFVDSIWELFGPLLKGVPVTLISEDTVKDFSQLVETLAATRVTRVVLVPSLLDALLENEPDLASRLGTIELWTCSGEALSVDLLRRFRAALPRARLLNLYGSSEVAADVTCCDTAELDLATLDSVPIGRPISNTGLYVLGEQLEPVPVGVPGELYVAGANLARGYYDRPELTAERFIQNPFSDDPDSRLFRTGDRVRYRADGLVEYIGRADDQIKIRGSRVEPGEVETALAQHPAVREAVVVAREDRPGERRIVAYTVGRDREEPHSSDLRTFLRDRLPEFMVPTAFVNLDALPLTPNGKVDRRALPAPEGAATDDTMAPPTTPMEVIIAEVWQESLDLAGVSIYDNFFDLGGHSLLAMKVSARLQRRTGVRLNPGVLVNQNLGQLAKVYEGMQRRGKIETPKSESGLPGQMFQAVKRFVGFKKNGSR